MRKNCFRFPRHPPQLKARTQRRGELSGCEEGEVPQLRPEYYTLELGPLLTAFAPRAGHEGGRRVEDFPLTILDTPGR